MKNIVRHTATITLAALIMSGCNNKQQTQTAIPETSDSVQSTVKDRSELPSSQLTVKNITKSKKNEVGEFELSFDFPENGNATLVNAIREYISESLGTCYGGGEDNSKQGSYNGDLADGEKMADYYFSLKLKEFEEMNSTMKEDGAPEIPPMASSTKITKDYETDKVVTFLFKSYENAGGAHGGSVGSGMSFRKSDGRRIGWELFTATGMQSVIRNGLKEYFEVKTDEELEGCLTLNDTFVIPMPVTPPLFGKDGIIVTYQQYEIAAYAAGMPSFTIPYDKAKGMMNQTGKNLLP
jgi:hypothetical protein